MERGLQPPEGNEHQAGHQPEHETSPEQQSEVQPRIYVACLSSYNNGILHGEWINANQDVGGLWSDIAQMLAASPTPGAEEWAIHDSEDFYGLRLNEYENVQTVSRIAKGITEHGEAFALLAGYASLDDLDFLEAAMRSSYLGVWDSMDEFVEHVVDDMAIETYIDNAPESYRQYLNIDKDKLSHDLEAGLTILEGSDRRIHVFDPNR